MLENKLNILLFELNENSTGLVYNPKNSNKSVINSNLFKFQFVNKEIIVRRIEFITYIGRNIINCKKYPDYYDATNLNIMFKPTEITTTVFSTSIVPYWYYTGDTKYVKHSFYYNSKNYTTIESQFFGIAECSSFLSGNKYYSQYVSVNINYDTVGGTNKFNTCDSFVFKVKVKGSSSNNNNNKILNPSIYWLFYGCSISYSKYELIILDKLYKKRKRKDSTTTNIDHNNSTVYKKIKNC